MNKIKCPICKNVVRGRTDKKFCSQNCKNAYHGRLKKATLDVTGDTDKILHRNRSILLETLLYKKYMEIDKMILLRKGFKFQYCTGTYINAQKKQCYYIYDYMWFELSNQAVHIKRIKK